MQTEEIDVVILWVNDKDPDWFEKKKYWQNKYNIKNDQPERFRDWDNLVYMFRGFEKFAPWINHIYLVTDNQKPDWLNTSHDKITIVDHKDILPKDVLPTFNSRVLELNLHRIPGLSEHFIYMNDDIFFINHMSPDDFFKNGIPRDKAALNLIMPIKDNQLSQVVFNNTTLINEVFDKRQTILKAPNKWFNFRHGIDTIRTILLFPWPYFSGFKQIHLTGNFRKSTYNQIWEMYEEELLESNKYRFRNYANFNQWLVRDWQLASNNFVPLKKKFGKVYQLTSKEKVYKCVDHIKKQKTKLICINDTEKLENFEEAKKMINDELNTILSKKSSFEK